MSSTTGGNFCTKTGQSNWCSSSLGCHEDGRKTCRIQNWCVCEWAFASYIEKTGGCDHIQNIVCESINIEAIRAYKTRKDSDPHIRRAYECLVSKCNISNELL